MSEDKGKKAEIYLPSVAVFSRDLERRHRILEPAREQGFRAGLMLVIRGPQDLTPEAIQKQIDNLSRFTSLGKEEKPAIFVMHPNKPLTGPERLNFLTNPDWSQDYVEQSVEFASKLPTELFPETGQTVSFHLNTLVTPMEWVANEDHWKKTFETIQRKIKDIVSFASRYDVKVAIETAPITEFGDIKRGEDTLLEHGIYWDELGNPWPLFPWREEIKKLREAGASLAIDWCHSFIAMSTVSEVKQLASRGRLAEALSTYMIFESDLAHSEDVEDFSNQLLQITVPGDIWHANDARGIYKTPSLHEQSSYFEEGVPLFEGEIPEQQLRVLIKEGLRKPIKFVLEISETDFENNPNTRRSLKRVLKKKEE